MWSFIFLFYSEAATLCVPRFLINGYFNVNKLLYEVLSAPKLRYCLFLFPENADRMIKCQPSVNCVTPMLWNLKYFLMWTNYGDQEAVSSFHTIQRKAKMPFSPPHSIPRQDVFYSSSIHAPASNSIFAWMQQLLRKETPNIFFLLFVEPSVRDLNTYLKHFLRNIYIFLPGGRV